MYWMTSIYANMSYSILYVGCAMGSLSQFLSTGILSDLLGKEQTTLCCPKAYSKDFSDTAIYQDPHAINIFLQIKNRLSKTKTIRVLYYDGFEPVCYPDRNKDQGDGPAGLDPDILRMFAEIAGCKLVWTRALKYDGISNFKTKEQDIAIGGIANTTERLEKISTKNNPIEWTMPYYYVKRSFLIRKDGVQQNWLKENNDPGKDIDPSSVMWTTLPIPKEPLHSNLSLIEDRLAAPTILRIMFATFNSTGWKDALTIQEKVMGKRAWGKIDSFFTLMPGFNNEDFELQLLKENKIMTKDDFISRVKPFIMDGTDVKESGTRINEMFTPRLQNKGSSLKSGFFRECKSIKVVGIMRGNDVCKSLAAKLNKETKSDDYTYRTWDYLKKTELSSDGEVFAFPVSIESNICAALSSFIGYLITCGELDKMMAHYKM